MEWKVRSGAGGQVFGVLLSLKLALEHSHPFYKECLFTEASICMAQRGLGGPGGKGGPGGRAVGAGREQKCPAVGLAAKLSPGKAQATLGCQPPPALLRMWPSRPLEAGLLPPEPGFDAHFVYTSSTSILRQAPWDEGERKSGVPWARPAGGVLLALLLFPAQSVLLPWEARTVCGACGERGESRGPRWGPTVAPRAPLPFPDRAGVKGKWSQPWFSLSLNPHILSCDITQSCGPDAGLSKL